MSGRERTVAVLFADLGGSTRLYDERGDQEARRITRACIERMVDRVEKHEGRVVKTIGDEVMATFESAEDGLTAAAVISSDLGSPESPMGSHIGLHFGPVIEEHGDVFGDTVNVAARLVSLAVDGEVLTSSAVHAAVPPMWRERLRPFDRRSVEGKRDVLEIYTLAQASPEATTIQLVPRELQPQGLKLVLRYGDDSYEVDDHHPSITIGRSSENDIVLPAPWISRRHARIKLRHGKYVLCDESSNGTWIRRRGGGPMRLHREEMILPSAGELGARPAPELEVDLPVSFEIVEAGLPGG
ncbi:MAG: adenylate/guanylate cyclase domain-containing protein [Myxococcota bacterium]